MNKLTENQLYDLITLKLSGEANKNDLLLLANQLLLQPQYQFLYDQMLQPMPTANVDDAAQAYAAHIAKMQLQGKLLPQSNELVLGPKANKNTYKKLFFATAVAASIIGVIFYFIRIDNDKVSNTFSNEIVTKKGSKSTIKLPDGTSVILNADSKILYPENFGKTNREITLIGEAFFDVKHNANNPFIIHTGKADIKVIGTAFNVRNYAADKTMETTLIRGKIEVTILDRPDEKIIIHPQEKLIIANDIANVAKQKNTFNNTIIPINKVVLTAATFKDSVQVETSWTKDKMICINQPFEKIAQDLERKFAVDFIFKTNTSKAYRYTGVFDNEGLNEILHIIQLSKKINYSIKNKIVTID